MATQATPPPPSLRTITKGPRIFKRWLNPVIEYVLWLTDEMRKNKPAQGKNVALTQTPTGLKIDATGENTNPPTDFSLYDASSNHAAEKGLWVGVRFGVIQCYSRANELLPWPEDFKEDTKYKCEFKVTATGMAWVEIHNDTTDDYYKVSQIKVGNGTALPDQEDDNSISYLVLGAWQVDTTGSTPVLKFLSGDGPRGIGSQMYNFGGYAGFFAKL